MAAAVAIIASQRKRNVRSDREHDENRRQVSAVKTHFHRLESAVAEGDASTIDAEHRELVSRIDRAARTGALHRNTAARKKARAARILAGAS